MAQRGVCVNWGRRGKRNPGPRRNTMEVFRRIEALEAKLQLDEFEDKQESLVNAARDLDPLEKLIEALKKQGSKV